MPNTPAGLTNTATIQLPPDSTGKQLDAVTFTYYNPTTGLTETHYAQSLSIVDAAGNVLTVASPDGGSRLSVRDSEVRRLLEQVTVELRQISIQLAALTNVPPMGIQGEL